MFYRVATTNLQKMPITIKEIPALETYSVRHPVLRAGRPIEDCAMEGDGLESTFHLAAMEEDRTLGVATFLINYDKEIGSKLGDSLSYYQLRGMAVLPQDQGVGIGKKLLLSGIKVLEERNIQVLWFNARIKAVPFYEKIGFQIIGSAFEVVGIGTHYKMFKAL